MEEIIISLLLLCYYSFVTAGLCRLSYVFLRRVPSWQNQSPWILSLLGFGLFPVLISWGGMIGLFRLPFLPELLNLFLAISGAKCAVSYRKTIQLLFRNGHRIPYFWPVVISSTVLTFIILIAKHCYFFGGANNWPQDEIRAYSMVSSFAANYLKPAFPLNFSEPISYSYYLFEYLAFLYAGVRGFFYPSILSLFASVLSFWILVFSLAYASRFWFNQRYLQAVFFTSLAAMFYGYDFLEHPGYYFDWWTGRQLTMMTEYIHFEFHYLLSMAFAVISWLYIEKSFQKHCEGTILIAIYFTLLSLTYATINGFFFATSLLFLSILWVILRRDITFIKTLMKMSLMSWGMMLSGIILILLPQLATFVSRNDFVHIQPWPISYTAVWEIIQGFSLSKNWETLTKELGILHTISMFFLLCGFIFLRAHYARLFIWMWVGIIFCSIFALNFVNAGHDWYWRSGNNGLLICSIIAVVVYLGVTAEIKSSIMRRLMIILNVLLFLPCMYNVYSASKTRYYSCFIPPQQSLAINYKVPLHDPIIGGKSSIYFAGRSIIATSNEDALNLLEIYRTPKASQTSAITYSERGLCSSSLYGSRMPDNKGTLWQYGALQNMFYCPGRVAPFQ